MAIPTSIWKSALGTNTIWGIPFGFLVMLAVLKRTRLGLDERGGGPFPVRL